MRTNPAICVVLPDRTVDTLFQDDTGKGFYTAFDWGPSPESAYLVLCDSLNSLSNTRIQEVRVPSGEWGRGLDVARIRQSAGSGDTGYVSHLATRPHRSEVAMIIKVGGIGRELYLCDLDSGRSRLLHTFAPKEQLGTLAWTPDGKKLACDLHQRTFDVFLWEPKR
jgi:hypothetical protein